jgi:hypothetical protein
MHDFVPLPAGTLTAELDGADRYQEASLSPATRAAYADDWRA